jgi:uncharacterized NAD(P)/FAD-binding protein YdhS/predicted metal-dependent enzyme (double-stranded beta helix superfamily)
VVNETIVRRLLGEAQLDPSEVAGYVEHRPDTYARRCVVRREHFEVLVLTWSPTQGSVAHDHSGSLCGLKIVQGSMIEQLFEKGPDGRVRKTDSTQLSAGEITIDPGVCVHSLGNASPSETLVTVHVYSPPLPEIRRYAVTHEEPPKLFVRQAAPDARVIAIIGGGFTGLMTLANLLRFGNGSATPLHLVFIDRQTAIGEGVAYRTTDARHLLNVPAGRMSAWPDIPNDFLEFARSKDPSANPTDFLQRRMYGQYVRQRMIEHARVAGEHLSAEVVRDEVTWLGQTSSGWTVETHGGRAIHADVAILAVGHRPPKDPLSSAWTGPRTRFIADPWAALVLSQIGPDEPVLLIGSGLTAVDVILTLNRPDRVAPLIAVSRHGFMPLDHLREPRPAADLSPMVKDWLDPATPLTTRRMLASLRKQIEAESAQGIAFQQIIDALRPEIACLWNRLGLKERARFLRHVRPFWEVHRHRMAPAVADTVARMRREGLLEVKAGSLVSARADADAIDVEFRCRGAANPSNARVSWVVNCTGPGAHNLHSTHPFVRPLLCDGSLCTDEFELGLLTDDAGRAIKESGSTHWNLLIAGTLRKATLWESTAVPELRQQAQTVARTAIEALAHCNLMDETARLKRAFAGFGDGV